MKSEVYSAIESLHDSGLFYINAPILSGKSTAIVQYALDTAYQRAATHIVLASTVGAEHLFDLARKLVSPNAVSGVYTGCMRVVLKNQSTISVHRLPLVARNADVFHGVKADTLLIDNAEYLPEHLMAQIYAFDRIICVGTYVTPPDDAIDLVSEPDC